VHWLLYLIIFVWLLILAIWPFYVERRRPRVGPTERHGAEGEFARLSQGVTYFRWIGPARGPVAVLINGMANPMIAVEKIAEGLGEQGYRVLVYDLYGRGLSDAPRGPQNRAFFMRQLSDLMAYHELREEITIAGYSVGGTIATAYAAEYPHMVKQVILIAPGGIITSERRFGRFCRRVPLLGDWVHGMFAEGRIKKTIPEHGPTQYTDKVYRTQRKQVQRRGYLPALLATRRGILTEVQEKEHRSLGRQGIAVCAVWAAEDTIVPLRAMGQLAEWNRAARQEMVELAGHDLTYTHPDQTNTALRSVLHD